MHPDLFDRALRQVATLASLDPTHRDLLAMYGGIVLQTLERLGTPATPERIASSIRVELGIALTINDVVEAVGRLVEQRDVIKENNFAVALAPDTKARLARQAGEADRLRIAVTNEWLEKIDKSLAERGSTELNVLERAHLESDLDIFLLHLVRYHGAEVASFLYPSSEETRPALDIDDRKLLLEMPAREDRIKSVRHEFLPAFVREASPARAAHIADRLNRATLLQILQVDASASALFKHVVEPKWLYLDTNFVFRALGLQGEVLRDSTREILSLSLQLGHSLAITGQTYQELDFIVKQQSNWLNGGHEIPEPVAAVAAEFVAGNDYVSSYWRDRASRGTTATQFRETFGNIRLLLENLNIQLVPAEKEVAPSAAEVAIEAGELKRFKPNADSRVVEHDAYHKLLIENLRLVGKAIEPQGWHETTHLFLTFDNALPRYAAQRSRERRGGHKIPFCLMANEWLQILFFIRPDINIPATTVVSLINSPYLQAYFSARTLSREIVRNIAWTMSELGEYRPEVARKLYADRLFTKRLKAANDEEERKTIMTSAVEVASREENNRLHLLIQEKEARLRELEATREESRSPEKISPPARLSKGKKSKSPNEAELRDLRNQFSTLENKLADYSAVQEQLAQLRGEVVSLRAKSSETRLWLLVFPAFLLLSGLGRLVQPGPISLFAILLLFFGAVPLLMAVHSHFRGKLWEILNRVSAVVTIVLVAWDRFPFFKEKFQSIMVLLGK